MIASPLITNDAALPAARATVHLKHGNKKASESFDWRAFSDEAYSRLTVDQLYTHASHQFKQLRERSCRGGCPFHDSKSGTAFVVTQENLLFYCAGCQFGGSGIDYLHSLKVGRWDKPRGKDFIGAAKELAQLAGMTFPDIECSPEEIEKLRQWESRREILQAVGEYGEEVLWSSRGIDARNYLINERGFTEEQIKSFNLGLYLSRKEVEKVLLDKGYNLDDAKNAGVLWNKLEGYILFPWKDSQGRPLTIYGRYQTEVPPEGKPKTIALKGEGTKQSPLYFDKALQAGHKHIVLVEGVIDAALLQAKGDTRVSAYVGASCSELQIKTLVQRRIESVILCGDPDAGGDNGTLSNIKRIMAAGIDVYVAPKLPDGLDPDEFVNKVGMEGWKAHINNANHAFSYMARVILNKHDITNDRGKLSTINEAFSYGKEFTEPKFQIALETFLFPEISKGLGMDKEELFGYFNSSSADWCDANSVDAENGDSTPKNEPSGRESRWQWQRENWNAPISHQGEIGFWEEDKEGNRFFNPACNFDFQVEREIQDADGGGIVLQVKRSFEDKQLRVIINSTDYTKVDVFENALKRAIGTGISCNLNKTQLNALIHTRLHEYRTNRGGQLFKRIDRYGQQADGTWVLGEVLQYKKDGTRTNENESGWVFNPSLGKEDFIPCPELAPENPLALKRLINASRTFFGAKNIYQLLLTIGWTVAGLNSQKIFAQEGSFSIGNGYGVAGSLKTIGFETAASLIGKNWPELGILVRVSTSALYELGSRLGSIPFFWDDPPRCPETEELAKNWFNRKPRRVRGNEQTPHSPMAIISNHVLGGEQAATYTRMTRIAYDVATGGDKAAFQELKAAQAEASGAFPQLIALGYPKKAIDEIESELLQYLPYAHARIAQSLAIVTWYAQKVVDMTNGSEDIKQWVIENCCQAENDSDASGDSLKDYLDKILTLESENSIGDWNFKRNVERDGQLYHALYAHDAWKLLDHRFKPATYNERSLKALVIKAGGITNTTFRFSSDRDLVLAYKRAFLVRRTDADGNSILPRPPGTLPRKAWLIPASLWDEEGNTDKPVTNIVTTVTDCNQNPVTPSNPDDTSTFDHSNTNCNHVTNKKELEKEKDDEKKFNTIVNPSTPGIEPCNQNSGYTGYTPLESEKTEENRAIEPVTPDQLQPVTRLQSAPDASLLATYHTPMLEDETVTGVTGKPEKSRHEEKNKSTKPSGHSLQEKIIDLWSDHLKLGELVFKASRKELDRALASWSDDQKAHVMSCLKTTQEADLMIMTIRNMPDQFDHDSVTKLIKSWKPGFREAVWYIMTPQEREVECFRQINPNGDLGNAQELGLFKLE
ncbi:toprim domain-containing protein [Nostoc sp. CHAB 5834]|nr:toprim domain-containing protein [Nostoc sp. CHAB 5834]